MENYQSRRMNDSGNVALELIVSLVLTVVFLVPTAETVYQIYQNRSEALSALDAIARTFQVSPEATVRTNIAALRIQLQRRSHRGLQIYLKFNSVDGVLDSLEVDVAIDSNLPIKNKLHFTNQVRRASFVS